MDEGSAATSVEHGETAFDNQALALPVGTKVRAETIVSFGNATRKGKSAPSP